MYMQIGGDGLSFPDGSAQNTAATGFGFKNRLFNGSMMQDQRNAGAVVIPTNGQYTLDRWKAGLVQLAKYNVQQSSTAPAGFVNSLAVTSLSSYSVLSADYFTISQAVEGLNVVDLNWGSASAVDVTLSFWVRSSLTGSFGGAIGNADGTRCYPFSYTISAANTWELKSVVIPGDQSGTWLKTNGIGLVVTLSLGAGSGYSGPADAWTSAGYVSVTGATSVVGTNGATLYVTGVQLEKGGAVTDFDYRPYTTERQLCQRYAWKCDLPMGLAYNGINLYTALVRMPVTMRTAPSLDLGAAFTVSAGSAGTPAILSSTGSPTSPDGVYVYNSSSSWTPGTTVQLTALFNAEL